MCWTREARPLASEPALEGLRGLLRRVLRQALRRISFRKSGGSLGGFLNETGDRVGKTGTVLLPVGETFLIDLEADGLTGSHRVVVADAFDEAAVTAAAAVADVDGVERTLLGATAGETNDNH